MGLDVGDAGVVVDHGVQKARPDHRVAPLAARCAGASDRGAAVLLALLPADVTPPATVGDLPELLDVDVDHVAGPFVFVATDRFPCRPVEMDQAVDPAPDQDRVDRRGRHPQTVTNLDRAESLFPPQMHDLANHRRRRPARLMIGLR